MAKNTEKQAQLPEVIDEVDALKYEKLLLQMNSLDLQKQVLQGQLNTLGNEINAKYKITEKDQVDLQTRQIKRAAADEAAKS